MPPEITFDDFRNLVPGNNLSPLESKGPDDLGIVGVDLRNKTGVIVLERVHLRQVAVVHEKHAGGRTDGNRKAQQEYEYERTEVAS